MKPAVCGQIFGEQDDAVPIPFSTGAKVIVQPCDDRVGFRIGAISGFLGPPSAERRSEATSW
jgi:hypothetical protein